MNHGIEGMLLVPIPLSDCFLIVRKATQDQVSPNQDWEALDIVVGVRQEGRVGSCETAR